MYVRLFSSLLDSSIWLEADATVRLWIAMLCMANQEGLVLTSVGGLARRANVSKEDCEAGLAVLAAPDPDSKDPDNEGRRIERVVNGWLVLNHHKYREIEDPRRLADARRQRRCRVKQKGLELEIYAPIPASDPRGAMVPVSNAIAQVEERATDAAGARERMRTAIELVAAYFKARARKGQRWMLTSEKETKVRARLKENGMDVSELFWAIDGAMKDPWITGEDPKSPGYLEIRTIFRDRSQVERFVQMAGDPDTEHPTFVEMAAEYGVRPDA